MYSSSYESMSITDDMSACDTCEVYVTRALSSPLVRSLLQGLRDAGCPIDLPRHVVCEPCSSSTGTLAGGYRDGSQVFVVRALFVILQIRLEAQPGGVILRQVLQPGQGDQCAGPRAGAHVRPLRGEAGLGQHPPPRLLRGPRLQPRTLRRTHRRRAAGWRILDCPVAATRRVC